VRTVEFDFSKKQRNPTGDFPPLDRKAKAYNKSNSSKVNMMPSHNALELNKGGEKAVLPCTKIGREMKYAAN
jgi:hypothetical protein